MELILLIGIQASGKSSFYRERFSNTHVRINLDMLKTLERERLLVDACINGRTPFVVDKMNLTREQRARYIAPAKAAGFSVHGYYFPSRLPEVVWRNLQRNRAEQVPEKAIHGANQDLQLPSPDEHFDRLFQVRFDGQGGFLVEAWKFSGLPEAQQNPH